MEIRKYQQSDCRELTELFYNTVHTVNAKDYMEEQLNVWATGQVDLEKWSQSLQEHYSIVAVENKRTLLLQQNLFSRKEDIKLLKNSR